jgi:inner membrane protein
VAAAAIGTTILPRAAGSRVWSLGIACAILPDLDVVAFAFGIPYSSMLGHRGLSHSISFALLVSLLATALALQGQPRDHHRLRIWSFLFLAAVSHGVLDAFTNGGLGIAFFAPFSAERCFFPVTPIQVSPIGAAFFSERGLRVLTSEVCWVCLPAALLAAASLALQRTARPRE